MLMIYIHKTYAPFFLQMMNQNSLNPILLVCSNEKTYHLNQLVLKTFKLIEVNEVQSWNICAMSVT